MSTTPAAARLRPLPAPGAFQIGGIHLPPDPSPRGPPTG
jgi:hypothetical protein